MMKHINKILNQYKIKNKQIINYGKYFAKLDLPISQKINQKKNLILITSMNPTPYGVGKTTIAIGLCDSLNAIGHKAIVTLREPSIGPVFGKKGGATGGGLATIIPEDKINLHFTGDFHAIALANNLICAIIDNIIYQGNKLQINPHKILFKRVIDMNDRSLRDLEIKINDKISYHSCFYITAACELMSIFVLSKTKQDFFHRLNSMVVAFDFNDKPITVKKLHITNAVLAIMEDCFMVNVAQTKQSNLAIISGGPFANVSVGTSSILGTKIALQLADYVVIEAGFGSELGAEKFLNIIVQQNKLPIKCIVLIVTIKTIYFQGNGNFFTGLKNIDQHLNHLQKYSLPYVIAINKFANDKESDLKKLEKYLQEKNLSYSFIESFTKGKKGAIDLAKKVVRLCKQKTKIKFLYKKTMLLEEKIKNIVNNAYGIKTIKYTKNALQLLKKYNHLNYHVCFAKNQLMISDTFDKNGNPIVFIKNIIANYGAKLIIIICNNICLIPGLPKKPRAITWK